MGDVLFVDDEQLLLDVFERLFKRHGIQARTCSSAVKAMEVLEEESFKVVVTDFKMPEVDGLELLAHVRSTYPETAVIMITAHANLQHAVRTMKHGAIDYIPKPFSTEELVERVRGHIEGERSTPAPALAKASSAESEPNARTIEDSGGRDTLSGDGPTYVGEHPQIRELKQMLPRISKNDAPVFIQGESGTGKEVLARVIHEESGRSDGPFVALNCANLPSELVESHLFGHRKGAFTGAIEDMTGAFEHARGGTLLLDEVTEIDSPIQAKMLRVLQEQEFRRVGDTETRPTDVRVIATSNRDLDEAIETGTFREDLYHRLSVFPVIVPPLRKRTSDIPLLVDHFISKYCDIYGLPEKECDEALLEQFKTHNWPGNVRQLENLVQRGVLLSADRQEIKLTDVMNDFFTDTTSSANGSDSEWLDNMPLTTIEEMERKLILQTLERTGDNQKKAAKKLGVSARTIRNKLSKYREQGLIE
jgi:DNA-binding NtrC family response regulator